MSVARFRWCLLVVFFLWAALGAPGVARAVLKISVCGHATYDCPVLIDPDLVFSDFPVNSVVGTNRVCNADESKCVYVPMNPNQLGPTPSGWTSYIEPPATAGAPTVTLSAGSLHGLCQQYAGGAPTPDAIKCNIARTNAQDPDNGNWGAVTITLDNETTYQGTVTFIPSGSQLSNGGSLSKVNSCPAGYTNDAGTCTLSDAPSVVKPADGHCTVVRSGNTFTGDANDPDCSLADPTSPAKSLNLGGNGSGDVSQSLDGDSANQKNNADGSSVITLSFANANGTTTQVKLNLGVPDGSGVQKVTGGVVSTVQGIGDSVGAGGGVSAGDPVCGASPLPSCDVKIDETGTPTDFALQTERDAYGDAADLHKAQIESVGPGGSNTKTVLGLSWSINWPTTSCTDLEFGIEGRPLGTIPWCAREADIKSAMNWWLAVLTSLGLFFMGARAVGSGGRG